MPRQKKNVSAGRMKLTRTEPIGKSSEESDVYQTETMSSLLIMKERFEEEEESLIKCLDDIKTKKTDCKRQIAEIERNSNERNFIVKNISNLKKRIEEEVREELRNVKSDNQVIQFAQNEIQNMREHSNTELGKMRDHSNQQLEHLREQLKNAEIKRTALEEELRKECKESAAILAKMQLQSKESTSNCWKIILFAAVGAAIGGTCGKIASHFDWEVDVANAITGGSVGAILGGKGIIIKTLKLHHPSGTLFPTQS